MTTARHITGVGSEMPRRRVSKIDPSTLKAKPLADFWLEADGMVRVEWYSDWFREYAGEDGIITAAGVHKPEHGRTFYEALPLALSNSSFIEVVDIE